MTTDRGIETFSGAVLYGANLMGCRDENLPNSMFLNALHNIFLQHHKDITCAELRLAFELYTAQKIATQLEAYGEISGVFIGKLLNEFRAYRTTQAKNDVMTLPVVDDKPTDQQRMEIDIAWCAAIQKQFKEFKDKGAVNIPQSRMQYKAFVERGLLKKTDCEAYFDSARRHIIERTKLRRLKNTANKISLTALIHRIEAGETMTDEDIGLVESTAMEECIIDYYRSISALKI